MPAEVYTDEIAEEALRLISSGKTLLATSRQLGLPYMTLWTWVNDGKGLFVNSPRARDSGHDAVADECVEIADNGELEAQDRKVRIDTRLRLLGQWSRRYGPKVTHDITVRSANELTDDELAAVAGSARAIASPGDPRIPE